MGNDYRENASDGASRTDGKVTVHMRTSGQKTVQSQSDGLFGDISRRKMVALSACAVAFVMARGATPASEAEAIGGPGPSVDVAYAASAKRYGIVYKLGGGKNPSGQVDSVRAGSSVRVSSLRKPSRKGYTFTGWFKDASLTSKASRVYGKKSKSKRTVYASWHASEYSISYSKGGGRFAVSLPASFTIDTPTISLIACRKEGSPFGGWYHDRACTDEARYIKEGSTGSKRLYALWHSGSYWKKHMKKKVSQVNAVKARAGLTGSSFVFITDMHVPNNCLFSFELVDEIREKCGVKTVVNGGDSIDWSSTRDEARAILKAVTKGLSKRGCDTYFVRGNHDGNDENHEDAGVTLSNSDYRKCVFGNASYVSDRKLYYFHDDENAQIRYIFLDTGHAEGGRLDKVQERWLVDRMEELPSSWGIVIFLHRFYHIRKNTQAEPAVPTLDPNGTMLVGLLNQHRSKIDAEIIAVISGHSHRDRSTYHVFDGGDGTASTVPYALAQPRRGAGFLAFSTTCDAFRKARTWDDAHPVRVRGTVDEQAFDVVTIDRKARKVTCTRIGCGKDRVFEY